MPVALNTESNILRAWNARVHTSIYIYIYGGKGAPPFWNGTSLLGCVAVGQNHRGNKRKTETTCKTNADTWPNHEENPKNRKRCRFRRYQLHGGSSPDARLPEA